LKPYFSLSIKLKEEEDGIYKIRKVYVLGEITTDIYEEFQLEAEEQRKVIVLESEKLGIDYLTRMSLSVMRLNYTPILASRGSRVTTIRSKSCNIPCFRGDSNMIQKMTIIEP